MSNQPFNSDYADAQITQAAVNADPHAKAPFAVEGMAQPPKQAESSGFTFTPIPHFSGKPKRILIRGKVTRD